MVSPDEKLRIAARVYARLAHRLSDRETILERHGLDETSFRDLERDVLSALFAAPSPGLSQFAIEFAHSRAELLGIREEPGIRSNAPTSPGGARDDAPLTAADTQRAAIPEDFMETLHSEKDKPGSSG